MHNDAYICYVCGNTIVDHVYLIQRRSVRYVPPKGSLEYDSALKDAVDPWHGGIIVSSEKDPHCSDCYSSLQTVQELLDIYKEENNEDS